MKKGDKLYSILKLKCPRCHEGEMFETGSWSFKKSFDMHERCPECNLDYFPEPGYYYGAMFISYIWTAWFSLLFVGIFLFVFDLSQTATFSLLTLFMVVNFVYIFRVSRAMWINFNTKYSPTAVQDYKKPAQTAR